MLAELGGVVEVVLGVEQDVDGQQAGGQAEKGPRPAGEVAGTESGGGRRPGPPDGPDKLGDKVDGRLGSGAGGVGGPVAAQGFNQGAQQPLVPKQDAEVTVPEKVLVATAEEEAAGAEEE